MIILNVLLQAASRGQFGLLQALIVAIVLIVVIVAIKTLIFQCLKTRLIKL